MNCTVCGRPLNEAAPTCPSCGQDSRLLIVAPDGTRYGPYTILQVRQFATQGRVPPGGTLQTANGTVFVPGQLGIGAPAPPGPAYARPQPTYQPGAMRPAAQKSNTCLIVGIVVGAVILVCGGIMAALMAPVFVKARQKAQQASCMSNLNQISVALMQYVNMNNGVFPNAATWKQDIQPYLTSPTALVCPASQKGQESYAYNPQMSGASLAAITNPSTVPLIYDAGYAEGTGPPHDRGWNVMYADGHVSWEQATTTGY